MYYKKFYALFIIFSLLELLNRTPFPLPLSTYIYAILLYYWVILIITYIRNNYSYICVNYNGNKIILCNVICNLIMVIRGLYNSNGYWQYKDVLLNTGPSLFFFLTIYLSPEIKFSIKSLSYIIKYYLIASVC